MALGRLERREPGTGDQCAFLGLKERKRHMAHSHFLGLVSRKVLLSRFEETGSQ